MATRGRPCSPDVRRRRAAGGRLLALLLVSSGCSGLIAEIPDGRYGVTSVEVEGAEQMDDAALLACLATRERSRFSIDLGRTSEPECGVPPFDADRLTIGLWRWPWSEWPLFDRAVFERDVERVERWYRARGFYDARVIATEVDPPEALERQTARRASRGDAEEAEDGPAGSCREDCEAAILVSIDEGEPVRVARITLTGTEGLSASLVSELREALVLEEGSRFDEEAYDRSLSRMRIALADHSFAHGRITGRVEIDRTGHAATVELTAEPGPSCTFGEIRVEGLEPAAQQSGLCDASELVEDNAHILRAVSALRRGQRFSRQAIAEAQRAIYALGAFSSVEVEALSTDDRTQTVIPVVVRAVPGRLCRFGLGGGIQAGTRDPINVGDSVPEWDLHLLGFAEIRNLFGRLRKVRLEERPRVIFQNPSPLTNWTDPQLGNEIRLELREQSFLEPRTTLGIAATWDLGPDPYDGFFRHDIDGRIGPERFFFDGRLFAALRLRENLLFPTSDGPDVPSAYDVMYLEQVLTLDLRDDPRRPRKGLFLSMTAHEAGYFMPASWDYVRLIPEARGYVPLPFGLVLAGRFALGALLIGAADPDLDATSQRLGPQRFRLRGGGANSNRGYLPGELGDSDDGGLRRWLGSLELRLPVTADFGLVAFADVGDVHAGEAFRFDYVHLSMGLGLRYQTLVGPFRLDVGWQVPEMRVAGADDAVSGETRQTAADLSLLCLGLCELRFDGAVHITIGEAF